jgi:predicted outer membrane protein
MLTKNFISFLLFGMLTLQVTFSLAQAAPQKSAKEAALSENKFIAHSIEDNEDAMFLSQKAIDHATDPRIKELAQQMLEDYSTTLYAMEQLAVAGTGSSKKSAGITDNRHQQAADLNGRLSAVRGTDFDTLWVSNLLFMQQEKYDEMTQAKETVTNLRLKMAITDAIPLIRKHLTQLRALNKNLAKMLMQKKKEEARKK